MKIAIIGAGAVGGYYGALMARVGADVSFVARGAHRDAIRANGLRVIGVQGDFTVKVAAEDHPALSMSSSSQSRPMTTTPHFPSRKR
jgi:2-dehydropantoate 2-reductase